jgi:hypothetical protein
MKVKKYRLCWVHNISLQCGIGGALTKDIAESWLEWHQKEYEDITAFICRDKSKRLIKKKLKKCRDRIEDNRCIDDLIYPV